MYKKFTLAVALLCLLCSVLAQQKSSVLYHTVVQKRNGQPALDISLFSSSSAAVPAQIKNTVSEFQCLWLNRNKSKWLFQKKTSSISLLLPYKNKTWRLELIQQDITSGKNNAGKLTGKGSREAAGSLNGLHYQGYINGNPASLASLSVFENGDVMVMFANTEGNFNLGKINTGNYILYNSKNLAALPGFSCGAEELPGAESSIQQQHNLAAPAVTSEVTMLCKKVRIYWEADYKLYHNNFEDNFFSTTFFLSGLFNQMSAMYRNEGILVELAGINVWTTESPYNTADAIAALISLRTRWNSIDNNFNGDLCMLIDGAPTNNGGRAYILDNEICNRNYAYGYANIDAVYNSVPVYSWDVEVVTHETGHLFGSHHTHWCGWKTVENGCGAIDDCATTEPTNNCFTCSAAIITNPSAPSGFTGTVMSYCHMRNGIGINLANGFGPLPQETIRNTVANGACLITDVTWTGAVSDEWENDRNWSCGGVPNENSDVAIYVNVPNLPVIRRNVFCHKLKLESGSTVKVMEGAEFIITGKD